MCRNQWLPREVTFLHSTMGLEELTESCDLGRDSLERRGSPSSGRWQPCDWSHQGRGIYGWSLPTGLLSGSQVSLSARQAEVHFIIQATEDIHFLKGFWRKDSKVHPFFLGCFSCSHSQKCHWGDPQGHSLLDPIAAGFCLPCNKTPKLWCAGESKPFTPTNHRNFLKLPSKMVSEPLKDWMDQGGDKQGFPLHPQPPE